MIASPLRGNTWVVWLLLPARFSFAMCEERRLWVPWVDSARDSDDVFYNPLENLRTGGRQGTDPVVLPSGPYTSLANLEGSATAFGVYRVKAVVSDTMGCKLRKKKYLVGDACHL